MRLAANVSNLVENQLGGNRLASHIRSQDGIRGYSHYERQKYVPRNLCLSRGVYFRIALLGEEVVRDIARDEVVNLEFHRFPVPEPACADGQDNARDSEHPDDEVDGNVNARVEGFAGLVEDVEPEDRRVVDKAEDDLVR